MRKQISINLIINIISFLLKILIGLWIIPYLVKHIGVVAYGLVPLAMIFSEYIGLIIQSLNSAINRYLLIALQKKDFIKANQLFNTSLMVILLFILIQSIIMFFILWNLSDIIDIPKGLESDAFYLFALTYMGFSISLLRGVITTPLFSHNRLDLLRVIEISQIFIRIGTIVTLFTLDSSQLKYVGIANFLSAFVVFFLALYFSRRLAPELKINRKMIKLSHFKNLSSMAGWVLVNQIGSLLFLKVDLFIANKFLGVAKAGEYAIVLQWSTLIMLFSGMLAGVLSPVVMTYYAKNLIPKMIEVLRVSFRVMAITIAILIGILSAISGDLLALWLGEDFRYLEHLLMFSLLPLIFNLSVRPLFAVNIALNRVKIPAIVTLILGMLNLILAILLVSKTELGLYGIILAGGIILTMKNTLFLPAYSAYILNLPKFTFMKYHLLSISFFIISFFVTKYFISLFLIDSLLSFILVSSGSFLVILLFVALYVYFDSNLRSIINLKLNKKLIKKENI
jgi:membrane protein EpsK